MSLEPGTASKLLPPRPLDSHKGTYGHVLTVAGSRGMAGAGSLCSAAALKAGCGRVTWAHPGGAGASPPWEVMTVPVGYLGSFSSGCVQDVRICLQGKEALAIGPGLGRDPETSLFVRMLLRENSLPFVLDADGLYALGTRLEEARSKTTGVLTPHPGEAARLLGMATSVVASDPVGAAKEIANRSGCVAVVKGAATVVSDGRRTAVNRTGNPGMATAGSGDVLTGVVASFLAQGLSPWDAACLGVCLHGAAGDKAAEEGGRAITASDVLGGLQQAFLDWKGKTFYTRL